ncbi:MAG: hypothetical protein ACYSTY_06615 [Planctomycetota bacterium]|jgi:hypothetical protein
MTDPAAPERKNRPLLTISLVAAVLLVEAAVILGVAVMIGEPAEVSANDPITVIDAPEEEIVELLVLDAKLPNNRSGITYLYDTEVYVQVKRKFEDRVTGEFKQFRNEIRAEITAIWRTSDPRVFEEPMLETLTRKVYALLNDRFGIDPQEGEPVMSKCVIVMGTGIRVES